MGLFGQAKDMYKLQKQAKKIKEELKNLHIEAEINGIAVVINGEQEVVEVRISLELLSAGNQVKLQADLLTVFNKAVKKSQEIAAEKMRGMMGDLGMNMPGMPEGEQK
ncbi:MAG: YbaB/EbfC family nucleoid-associated protein [Candidatus Gracilibacteria bacterium]